ncbi:hypothetical protein [Hymenobacter tenuis]
MKTILLYSALAFLLVSTSCSSGDKAMEKTNRYGNVSMDRQKRTNDKSRFKQTRGPIGLGLDVNANNPYKFRTVASPKKYKYSKGGR